MSKSTTGEQVRSLYFTQDEILRGIIQLYCNEGFECDVTFGNGTFYKNIPKPKFRYDIQPQCDSVIEYDSQMIPHDNSSLNSIVFDPPFLTYVKGGRSHKGGGVAMSSRYGGYWSYSELEEHYRGTIKRSLSSIEK